MKRGSYRENDYSFGQTMLTLRSAIGLTQAGLAEILGVSRQSVVEWEAGSKYPKAKHLQAFIVLALQHKAFPAGRELDAIRELWKASHQKVLLDESSLFALSNAEAPIKPAVPAVSGIKRSAQRSLGFPFQPTNFIGRGDELAEIARILRDPSCRLITLIGPGGVGKTRLALEAAAGHADDFADGAAFISLASINTPGQIVSVIADTLNLSFDETNPAVQLIDYLSERHMLLVLDNFEHVLDGSALVYDILERAPRITIVVTSRERLNLRAEWLFDVEGLSYPPTEIPDENVLLNQSGLRIYSAVQLFIQRVTQVQKGLVLDETTLRSIVHICQRVVGMPLAIELAAAGVRGMSIVEIEQHINSNLDILATSLRDVPARQRSLRAVFDHSWNLMSAAEQVPFARLAVFRGGFTAEAAEKVAGVALPILLALVDKSLVRPANSPTRLVGVPRFFLLEPIREYALQKQDDEAAKTLSRTHALYFLDLAQSARLQWDTSTGETALEMLDFEHDNMRAALQWVVSGGDALIGLRMAEALARYWRSRVYLDEAHQWLDELLALMANRSDLESLAVRMRATYAAAMMFADQRNYSRAGVLFEQSRALRHALGEGGDESTMLINQAQLARNTGEYQQAIRLLEESLSRYRAAGDLGNFTSGGYGFVLYFLGHMLREQGEYARARAWYVECREFHIKVGDREAATQGLLGLSDIARDEGDAAEIRRFGQESLTTYREFGTQWAIGFSLNNLAFAAYLENELDEAFALISESLAMFRAQKSAGSIAEVLVTFGAVLLARGDLDKAFDALTESLRLAWVTGPRILIAAALEGLGCIMIPRAAADIPQAVQFLAAADLMRQQMGTPVRPADRAVYDRSLAQARAALGDETFNAIWSQAQGLPLEQIVKAVVEGG